MSIPLEVKEEIARFFERLYHSDPFPRPTLEAIIFASMPVSLRVWLEREFEEEEIKEALLDCEGNKASGPDGFNFIFVCAA